MPNDSKSLTINEAKVFAAQKFNNNGIPLGSISKRNIESIYKVGNVLVTLYPQQQHVPKSQLAKLLMGFNAMNKSDSTFHAEIKSLQNFSVLITNYRLQNDIEYYRFFVSDNSNANDVTGILEFNPKDATEGKQVLDNILANLKFKVQ